MLLFSADAVNVLRMGFVNRQFDKGGPMSHEMGISVIYVCIVCDLFELCTTYCLWRFYPVVLMVHQIVGIVTRT